MKEIKLTRGLVALVSDEDFERVAQFQWYANPGRRYGFSQMFYARCRAAGYMHRFIMNYPGHKVVDHIDGNGLNNQRENLRVVTTAENNQNKRKVEEPFL